MLKKLIKKLLNSFSYTIKKIHKLNVITFSKEDDKNFEEYYKLCEKESLNVSKERFLSLYQAINYVYKSKIEGDLVECGVFMGGSSMMMAFCMKKLQDEMSNRKKLWLYDTFEGMANASKHDENILNQKATVELFNSKKKENSKDIWAYSSLSYVKKNMKNTGLNFDDTKYVVGLVEDTLEKESPSKISILRLDTDFYESTKKELEILYPKLQVGGVIIVDDYGHWKGCKKAVDEYFRDKKNIFFQQVDYSGVIGVKTGK